MLFTLLIATIFCRRPSLSFPRTRSSSSWDGGNVAAIAVPTFFANAYDVFLLRQYLLTIPRDLDEAAALDGAGVCRPSSRLYFPRLARLAAVAIFTWCTRGTTSSVRSSISPRLQNCSRFRLDCPVSMASTTKNPSYIQAGT